LGRTDHLHSFHYIAPMWYGMGFMIYYYTFAYLQCKRTPFIT
jgi:hypothetical protein